MENSDKEYYGEFAAPENSDNHDKKKRKKTVFVVRREGRDKEEIKNTTHFACMTRQIHHRFI